MSQREVLLPIGENSGKASRKGNVKQLINRNPTVYRRAIDNKRLISKIGEVPASVEEKIKENLAIVLDM